MNLFLRGVLGLGLVCFGLSAPSDARAAALLFEPPASFTNSTPGVLPPLHGRQVTSENQDDFQHGSGGGWTPQIRLSSETLRLLRDQSGNTRTHGLEALTGGIDNIEFGQRTVTPEVWRARASFIRSSPIDGCVFGNQHPVRLQFDAQNRPLLAWVEFDGCGNRSDAFWVRPQNEEWQPQALSQLGPNAALSLDNPSAGAAFALASNGTPFFFYSAANFSSDHPYFLNRANLETSPSGPGRFVHLFSGGRGPDIAFDADGRASSVPEFVAHTPGRALLLNGAEPLTAQPIPFAVSGDLVFRQGPQGQTHVLYSADNQLRYNGGAPDLDVPILPVNSGNLRPHDLAIGPDNSVHVSAALGTGRFFFGAVGRLAYLSSLDGITWTTNLVIPEEDVGATAIALDSLGRPGIAFTRAFSSLFFTRQKKDGWTPPILLRTGLGGWPKSRAVRLAFDKNDVPHIAVGDALSGRLLVLAPSSAQLPADLAVEVISATNRAPVGANVVLRLLAVNTSTRDAAFARLRFQLPPELVVRDAQPRSLSPSGAEYTLDLGTLQAFEQREVQLTVSALDPVRVCVSAQLSSDVPDPSPGNNDVIACPLEFLPSACFTAAPPPECGSLQLLPELLPPAFANQPWSMFLRTPLAMAGAQLRVLDPLPPGFCLTSDGQLRGFAGAAGDAIFRFELMQPDGAILPFTRRLQIRAGGYPENLLGFWPLDGDAQDVVSSASAALGERAAFIPGVAGLAAQTPRNLIPGPDRDWAAPGWMMLSPPMGNGDSSKAQPLTLTAWFRRDGGRAQGADARPFGTVIALVETDNPGTEQWGRERHVMFVPETGRLVVGNSPPDFRANLLTGPILAPNRWHHLALVCDGAQTRLFVNGSLAAEGSFRLPLVNRPRVLAGAQGNGAEFTGAIDEIAIFSGAFTEDQVKAAAEPLPRFTPLPPSGDFPLAPVLKDLTLPDAVEGEPYATGLAPAFCGAPIEFAVAKGTLPPGLDLGPSGRLTGIPAAPGVFQAAVRARDAEGYSAEILARIAVQLSPPIFSKHPANQQVKRGAALVLVAETTRPASFQWHLNGKPIPGAVRSLLSLAEFSPAQAGAYQVRAENAGGVSWSKTAQVTEAPSVPPKPVDLRAVQLRPDDLIQLNIATAPGRIYELQRALDLNAALRGAWEPVQRFVAQGPRSELFDRIAGRPDAAFYRVIERIPPPAARFSLEDSARFIGISGDGAPRPGLLPAFDPGAGRLGAFEFHPAGGAVPLSHGLNITFPEGAQTAVRDGATLLHFRRAELFFGEDSPIQFDEGGANRIVLSSAAALELAAGALSVSTLETLLQKPPGAGVGVKLFRRYPFRLLRGTFDGPLLRGARLAWADPENAPFPMPSASGDFPGFDLDLTGRAFRIPFHGAFSLPDGTASAGELKISPARPAWLEIRPGAQLALSGIAELNFRNGPSFSVDFLAEEPEFRLGVRARHFRLPGDIPLSSLLSALPLPPPAAPRRALARLADRQEPANPEEYFRKLEEEMKQWARLMDAPGFGTSSEYVPPDGAGYQPPDPNGADPTALEAQAGPGPRPAFRARDYRETDAMGSLFGVLPLWRGYVDSKGGMPNLSPEFQSVVRRVVQKHVAQIPENVAGQGDPGNIRALEFRARLLEHVAAIAVSADDSDSILASAARNAYELLRRLGDETDCGRWEPASLGRAADALRKVQSIAAQKPSLLPAAAPRDLQDWVQTLFRCRGAKFARDLGVQGGKDRPDDNPIIKALHRYEAAAKLEEALALMDAGQRAAVQGVIVPLEAISQLIFHLWDSLRRQLVVASQGCDLGTWHYLLPELGEILKAYGELLASATGSEQTVAAIAQEIMGFINLDQSFGHCLQITDAASQAAAQEAIAAATDETLQPRFIIPALRALRVMLLDIPASVGIPLPAIERNLEAVRIRLEPIFSRDIAFWMNAHAVTAEDLAHLLEAGLLHDQLMIRLHPQTDKILLKASRTERLVETARSAAKRDSSPQDLDRIARVLLEAMRIQQTVENRPLQNTPAAASADVAAWRAEVLEALGQTANELHLMVSSLLEQYQNASLADALRLIDIRLPGGLTVEEAWGELMFHSARREISGRVGGALKIPGAGLALNLRGASLSSGGAIDAELSGSLALPPQNPIATLRIPSRQPARLQIRPNRVALSGGGQLQLTQGGEISCSLTLDDPIYQFSAAARGLRLRLARDIGQSIGLPLLDRLAPGEFGSAIDLLSRAGLILDSSIPEEPEAADDLYAPAPIVERPAPSDSDDLILAARTLDLALKQPGAIPNPAPSPARFGRNILPAAGPVPSAAISNLLAHIAARIERDAHQLGRDASEISQLDLALLGDAVSVSPAELAALRGPKLAVVARRLGAFGRDFQVAQSVLKQEQVQQLLGPSGIDVTAATQSYFQNFAVCLDALRSNLLVFTLSPSARWSKGPHWAPGAALETQTACLRFIELLQLTGGDSAALAGPAQRLFCDLAQAFLEDQIERASLNPATGDIPAGGEARARHLELPAERALELASQLLTSELVNQQTGWCEPDPRRPRAIAALALRARNALASEFRGLAARRFVHPWESPEAALSLAANLLDVITLPARLGIDAYPESAPRFLPEPGASDTLNPAADANDVAGFIGGAAAELERLHDDIASGYRGELLRRALALRRAPLPKPGALAAFIRLFPNLPVWPETKRQLANLAAFESSALITASAQAGFFARLQHQARLMVRQVIDLAGLMDAPAAAPLQLAGLRRAARETELRGLADEFLPRLTASIAAAADVPWWLAAGLSQELHEASAQSWGNGFVRDAFAAHALQNAQTTRSQLVRLAARLPNPASFFDLALPGDIEVQRLFGDISFNRESRFLRVEVGGRIEFPNISAGPGRAAFFDLERLRYESNGRFSFAAAARAPIPFPNASFTGRITAEGDWPHRALALSGRGELRFVSPPTNPETGQPFAQSVAASIAYEPIGFHPDGAPSGWQFRLGAEAGLRQSFGPHFAVFAASAGLRFGRTEDGQAQGGVTVGGAVGLIRKSSRMGAEPPSLEDFELAIEDAGVEIAGEYRSGGSAAITRGTLHLPAFFYPASIPEALRCPGAAPATGARVAIRDPIRLSYAAGDKPRLEGVLRFSQFGLRLPRAPFLSLVLCQADLGLDDNGLPFLDIARAGMQLDLPWDKGIFRLQDLHLGLDGEFRGQMFLTEDLDLVNAGGLRVTLPGANLAPSPAPPAACRGTSLTFEDVPNSPAPRVVITGGLRVQLPNAFVAGPDGGSVGGMFCGGIVIEPTPSGPIANAFVNELGFEGDFRFGNSGVALRRAKIAAANFDGILDPNPELPFLLSAAGDLQTGPFLFGLTNAQFRYLGPDRAPAFSIEAIRFSRDITKPLPPPLSFLPFALDYAAFRFKDPLAPIERLLHPSNLAITVSGRIGYPTVEKAFLRGAVSGVEFTFSENGELLPPAIDGFDLTLSSGAELKLPAFGDLGGKIRIGGLRRALVDGPGHIYGVGEIGGTQQGYRLNLLGAFNVLGPIGLCLDVNFGAAGLTLSPTPFQITGAAGGLAFLTTENPCDFTQYFVFDLGAGTYQLKQTVELPSIPIGLSWSDFAAKIEELAQRAAAFGSRFDPGEIELPDFSPAALANIPAVLPLDSSAATAPPPLTHAELAATPAPVQSPAGFRIASSPAPGAQTPEPFGCPTNCPPATVAIVCQPHPDRENYPNRIIFKFSSISEDRLTNQPPAGLGLTPAAFAQLGSDAAALGRAVADRLAGYLNATLPSPGAGLPPEAARFLTQQQAGALEGVRNVASALSAAAVRNAPDAYQAVRRVLYEGIPCPDLTIALSGRASLVGLSAFGWIEGRQVSSLSGSGGVVGLLYLLGVPLGEARAFISTTDDNGDPNPSFCGEVTASVGPLDLGRVDLAMRCDGCVTELLRLFPTVASAIGPPALRLFLDRLDPSLTEDSPEPAVWLARIRQRLEPEQIRLMLGVFNNVLTLTPGDLPPNLADMIRTAVADAWDRIDPRLTLCGEIQPRLLGFPLTLGGRPAALNFLTDKHGYTGEFAFSPSALSPFFPPGDEALLSFALRLPDPYAVLLDAFSGRLNDPRERLLYLREQIDYALQNQVVAAQYQWHPFGLELGDAAIRVLLPDLANHPAFPGRGWMNPDNRPNSALPSRDEVLVQAAASGKLGRAFEWLGSAADFSAIFDPADPRGQALRAQAADFRRDYFPHGGIVGGARMALPRILMSARSEWLPHYEKAVRGATLFEQAEGALTLLNDYILRNETNGTAAFYIPAPNPPLLYGRDGTPLSAQDIRLAIAARPESFSPEGLLAQIRGLDAGAPASLGRLYPDELAFFRAEITNLTLLGAPVFGQARITGRPTPMRLIDGQPLARFDVDIAGDSPIGRLAGGPFQIGFDLHATPDRSIASWGNDLAAELRAIRQNTPQRASPSQQAPPGAAALARFRSEIFRQLPRFASSVPLPPVEVADPRDWAGSGASNPAGADPQGRLLAGKKANVPPLLKAEVTLHAFSPFYNPSARDDSPLAAARREGGLAVTGRLDFLPGDPARSGGGLLEASVTSSQNQPRVRGRIRELRLPSFFPGFTLLNAEGDFDNQHNPFLRAAARTGPIGFGPLFTLGPAPGASGPDLTAAVTLGTATGFARQKVPAATIELNPVQLASPLLGGRGVILHGPGDPSATVIISENRWLARASLAAAPARLSSPDGLILRAELAGTIRDIVKIGGLPNVPFSFEGDSLRSFTLKLAAAPNGPLSIELFPGIDVPGLPQKTFSLNPLSGATVDFTVSSDGTFRLVGKLAGPFDAGGPGIFAAGAEARIDRTGAAISGQIGNTSGALVAGIFNNRLEAQFNGSLRLPRLEALGGRVILAGPDGGDVIATLGPEGACVTDAVLTLQNFAPNAAPVRIVFPAFCLDANRSFRDLIPRAPAIALLAPSAKPAAFSIPALPIGGFALENLANLRLTGGFVTRALHLAFESTLRVPSLFSLPIEGAVGSDGLRLANTAPALRLLGFDFSNLRLGATNTTGDLPAIGFSGRLPALPAPFNNLDFAGSIPSSGDFTLAPLRGANLPSFLPAFPIQSAVPSWQHRAAAYGDVIRAGAPLGYWPLQDADDKALDERLAAFPPGAIRRNGVREGALPPPIPGALQDAARRAMGFDGLTSWVRLPSDDLAPGASSFSISVWFRRSAGRSGVSVLTSPQTLAGRGQQWSLRLQGANATGTRLLWSLNGLQTPDGTPLSPLSSARRFDDDAWHHIAAVYDGGAQFLYIDGRLDAWQRTRGRVAELARADTVLGTQRIGNSLTEFFAGALDELALFPSALTPIEVQSHWLAAGGRAGLTLSGDLPSNLIPGLPATRIDGILQPDGSTVLQLAPGGAAQFSGVRLPSFQGTLLKDQTGAALLFESALMLPNLEAQSLGAARGVFTSDGSFGLNASSLSDRGLFGWNLRLTNLTASGSWTQRQLSASAAGQIHLPYNLAALQLSGTLNPALGTFSLQGESAGAFFIGERRFSYGAAPELTRDLLALPGELALGPQHDAAKFATRLEIQRSGEVTASMAGETPWQNLPGNVYGILLWTGQLTFQNGFPRLDFSGTVGLGWPRQPASLVSLSPGLNETYRRDCWENRFGFIFCADVLDSLTLKSDVPALHPNHRGIISVPIEPPFQGQTSVSFRIP